ncbi:MAG TPA: hypothetical protein VFB98_02290 [Candidatus Deferrimicrobium sp.]|nr:hypothetical protein [Candidatus Deferrimicrobium sp.]
MTNRIRIKMGAVEFEAEGDETLIERERERFFSFLPQISSLVTPVIEKPLQLPPPSPEGESREGSTQMAEKPTLVNVPPSYESLASLLDEKKFSTDVELVMGVAYYLSRVKVVDSFTGKDVENALNDAKQLVPKNISQCIASNINKGLLRECSEKQGSWKMYSVLAKGITWCESYVPTGAEQRKKSSRPKTPKVAKDSPLLSISVDDLHIRDYCEVSKIDKFEEQVLVVMFIYTKEKHIEYFSFEDIVAVFKEKFKLHATKRQVQYVLDKGDTMFDKKTEKRIALHRLMTRGIQEAERIVAQQRNSNAPLAAASNPAKQETSES